MENKEPKKWYEMLDEYERREEVRKDCKKFVISVLVCLALLAIALLYPSCEKQEEPLREKELYWKSRHDAIPETMKGEWTLVSEPGEIKMIVTDKYVMPENVTISPEQDNAVNVKDSLYTMYQNGSVYILSFGTKEYSKYLTLTVNNKCVARMQRFEPQTPTPTEPEQPNTNVN